MVSFAPQRLVKSFLTLLSGACIALAGFALHFTTKYNLPLPWALTAVSFLVPIADGFTTLSNLNFFSSPRKSISARSKLPSYLTALNLLLLILQTVSMTGNGAYLGNNSCQLHNTWEEAYKTKDSNAIKTVQDSLRCCGFRTVVDMPFPFPKTPKKGQDDGVDPKTCSMAYPKGGAKPCLPLWEGELKKVAGFYLGIGLALVFTKFVFLMLAFGSPNTLVKFFDKSEYDYRGLAEEVDDDDDEAERGRITNGPRPANGHSEGSNPILFPRDYGSTQGGSGAGNDPVWASEGRLPEERLD